MKTFINSVVAVFVLAVLIALTAVGCGKEEVERVSVVADPSYHYQDFGNGVLYFEYYRNNFGYALASYIHNHPDMKIDAIVEDGTSGYGSTRGYFIVVEKR